MAVEIISEVFKNSAAIFFSVKILTGEIDDMQGKSITVRISFTKQPASPITVVWRSDPMNFLILMLFFIKTSQLLKYPPYNKFCIGWQRSFVDKKCVTSLDFLSIHAKQNVHQIDKSLAKWIKIQNQQKTPKMHILNEKNYLLNPRSPLKPIRADCSQLKVL